MNYYFREQNRIDGEFPGLVVLEISERRAQCGLTPHYDEGTKSVLAIFPLVSFVLRLLHALKRSTVTPDSVLQRQFFRSKCFQQQKDLLFLLFNHV